MGDGANQHKSFVGFRRMIGDETNPTFGIIVHDASKALHICEAADADTDWNVSADSHPSVYIHSATTPATEYVKIYTDATTAYIKCAGAVLNIDVPASGTQTFSANSGEEILILTATTSAVNEITITSAATTASPTIGATGSGANIGLKLIGKGTGILQVGGTTSWTANGTSGVLLTTMGPTAAGTNVAEWFTVQDANGSVRYIPAWGA